MRPLHRHFLQALAAPLLSLAAIAPADAKLERYEFDPAHTRIAFAVDHFGYSHVLGAFARPTGVLMFNPDDWSRSKVDVTVELSTLELGDDKFEKRILKRDFLGAKKHPHARFVSTRIEPTGGNTAKVHGELTLRGVTRPLTLDARLNKLARNRYALMKKVAGFSATATLNRADWGMAGNDGVIGASVELRIEAEAVRSATTE